MSEQNLDFGPPPAVVTVEPRSGEPDIKRFSALSLNQEVDRVLERLGPKKHVVGVAVVTETGLHFAVVGRLPKKLPGDWSWTIYADHPLEKPSLGKLRWGVGVCWTD